MAVDVADSGEAGSAAHVLAVPTRAGIYRRLRTEGRPVSAREAAEMFGLHSNVARNHLDTLAEAGLVMVGRRKHPGGGRPAKVYVAREQADDQTSPAIPAGTDLAVGILAQSARNVSDGEQSVERIAEEHGRRLVTAKAGRAAERDFDAATVVAVEALRAAFPEVRVRQATDDGIHVEGLEVGLRLVGEADGAIGDAIARGLLRGALAASGTTARVTSIDGRVRAVPDADGALPSTAVAATVDARGRTYQAGVVLAMRAIMDIAPGENLEVLTDIQGAPAAFARWADRAGHAVIDVTRVRDLRGRTAVRLLLRRAPEARDRTKSPGGGGR